MDIMDDRFKRLNTLTGKLFEPGFKDENGRFFPDKGELNFDTASLF